MYFASPVYQSTTVYLPQPKPTGDNTIGVGSNPMQISLIIYINVTTWLTVSLGVGFGSFTKYKKITKAKRLPLGKIDRQIYTFSNFFTSLNQN